MVGTTVVLASRLMVAAYREKNRGSIIVDANTYSAAMARKEIEFETDSSGIVVPDLIKVKGRDVRVETYRPSRATRPSNEVGRFRRNDTKSKGDKLQGDEGLTSTSMTPNKLSHPSTRAHRFTSAAATNLLQRQGHVNGSFNVSNGGGGKSGGSLLIRGNHSSSGGRGFPLKRGSDASDFHRWPNFGRDDEVQRVQSALDDFWDNHNVDSELWRDKMADGAGGLSAASRSTPGAKPTGTAALMLIEGPSGIGKTSIMKRATDLADRTGICVIEVSFSNTSGGQGGAGFLPWFAMMDALREVVEREVPRGIDSFPKDQKRRINLMRMQSVTLQSVQLASSIMNIDGDVVDALFDELHSCVVWLVHEAMKYVPVALFVDDAELLGLDGLAIMHSLVAQNNLPGLMLVMALRPEQLLRVAGCEEIMDSLRGLASSSESSQSTQGGGARGGSVHLPLAGLDESGTEAVLLHFGRTEGVRSVETRVLRFIHERSEAGVRFDVSSFDFNPSPSSPDSQRHRVVALNRLPPVRFRGHSNIHTRTVHISMISAFDALQHRGSTTSRATRGTRRNGCWTA